MGKYVFANFHILENKISEQIWERKMHCDLVQLLKKRIYGATVHGNLFSNIFDLS